MREKQHFYHVFKLIWKISSAKDNFILICLFLLSILRVFMSLLPPIITAIIIAKAQGLPYVILGIKFDLNMGILPLVAIAFGVLFSILMLGSLIRAGIKFYSTKVMGKMNVYAVSKLLDGQNKENNYTNGEIAYIIKNSAESIPHFMESFLVKIFVPIISIIITMSYIATVNIYSFLIVFATVLFLGVIVFYRVYRNKRILTNLENLNAKINNNLLNDIDNLGLINFFNTKLHELKLIKKLNKDYYIEDKKRNLVYILYWLFIYIVEFVCSVLVVYFVMQTISSAQLASVIILLVPYLLKIYTLTEDLGFVIVETQQYSIKIMRINNVINYDKTFTCDEKNDKYLQNIEFKNEKIDKIYVKDYLKKFKNSTCSAKDVTFKRGQINCVVGSSGSGKTTFIKGVLGIIDYDNAEIVLNDKINIKNLKEYSECISIAFQDECFFDRSIIENIMYPESELNDKAKNLISYFGLNEIIARDQTEVISNSSFKNKFSGGEKKRMSIARALAKDAQVYILDEPTNELDKANVQKVIDLLQKMKNDCMIIVISHDSRMIEISENIIYIK